MATAMRAAKTPAPATLAERAEAVLLPAAGAVWFWFAAGVSVAFASVAGEGLGWVWFCSG